MTVVSITYHKCIINDLKFSAGNSVANVVKNNLTAASKAKMCQLQIKLHKKLNQEYQAAKAVITLKTL
jgi:hypothetical protein